MDKVLGIHMKTWSWLSLSRHTAGISHTEGLDTRTALSLQGLCMYLSLCVRTACMSVYVGVCACICAFTLQKPTSGAVLQVPLFSESLSPAWNLPIQLNWLPIEPQEPSCLCDPCSETISMFQCSQSLCESSWSNLGPCTCRTSSGRALHSPVKPFLSVAPVI